MGQSRVLVLGWGNMGTNHTERYKKLDAIIAAVIENDPARRRLAEEHGYKTYATLEEYIKENGIHQVDLADICLPTELHFEFIKKLSKAFESNPIVIGVEKPVVKTKEEADALEELVNKFGSLIFVLEVELFNSRLTEFLKSVENLSLVKVFRIVNKDYFQKGNLIVADPIMSNLMIHDISLLHNAFGEAKFIDGEFIPSKKYNCIGTATVNLEYKNVNAIIVGDWSSTDYDHPIVVRIEATDKNGVTKSITVDDYVIRGSEYDINKDIFYLELKALLDCVKTKKLPYPLKMFLDDVRLANEMIEYAAKQEKKFEKGNYSPKQFQPIQPKTIPTDEMIIDPLSTRKRFFTT